MTADEIVRALEAEGVEVSATERGTVRCRPTPSPGLLAELREHKAAVLTLLQVPNCRGWQMPSPEAMEAAHKACRDAAYIPPLIDLSRPGLGQQFKNEMQRLARLGLVILHEENATTPKSASGGEPREGGSRTSR